jgi:hypothetical protein
MVLVTLRAMALGECAITSVAAFTLFGRRELARTHF